MIVDVRGRRTMVCDLSNENGNVQGSPHSDESLLIKADFLSRNSEITKTPDEDSRSIDFIWVES